MPKTKISEFSATPGNNTDIDGINIAEGCAPSGINDAIRELMAQLKDFQAGTAGDSFNGPVGTSTAAAGAFTTLSATGVATFSSGTAGAPAITTTGDTNTGLFFPAADTVAASVGGTEGLRLTSTGLGVGASTPNYSLTAYKAGATATYLQVANGATGAGAANGLLLGVDTSGNGIINAQGAVSLNINVAGLQRATIDSSGNLGLGVTPSAWNSGAKALQISSTSSFYGTSNATLIGQNTFNNTSGNNIYLTTAAASLYQQFGGAHSWYTAPSGTAGNAISFTQALTLDASGNLGLGATSISALGSGYTTQAVQGANGSGFRLYQSTNERGRFYADSSGAFVQSITSIPLVFATDSTERARITSGGDLLVNRTSTLGTAKFVVEADTTTANPMTVSNSRSTAATDYSILFYRNASLVGSVQTSLTATSYVTSSDYRLKENIQPMTGALAKVAALKPVTYKWKATGGEADGFIAHELAEVCPQAVTGEKDAVDADGNPKYQGIDTSFLVATLTAALQELKAELDSVKTELNALKGT